VSDSISVTDGKARVTKDPNAVLDYLFDWSAWLDAHTPADTIATASVLAIGCTLITSTVEGGGTRVRAWISGGTVGQPASATCRINTAGGRTDDRTLTFTIKER
jgi:uncharacterized protein (DUF1501 family)